MSSLHCFSSFFNSRENSRLVFLFSPPEGEPEIKSGIENNDTSDDFDSVDAQAERIMSPTLKETPEEIIYSNLEGVENALGKWLTAETKADGAHKEKEAATSRAYDEKEAATSRAYDEKEAATSRAYDETKDMPRSKEEYSKRWKEADNEYTRKWKKASKEYTRKWKKASNEYTRKISGARESLNAIDAFKLRDKLDLARTTLDESDIIAPIKSLLYSRIDRAEAQLYLPFANNLLQSALERGYTKADIDKSLDDIDLAKKLLKKVPRGIDTEDMQRDLASAERTIYSNAAEHYLDLAANAESDYDKVPLFWKAEHYARLYDIVDGSASDAVKTILAVNISQREGVKATDRVKEAIGIWEELKESKER